MKRIILFLVFVISVLLSCLNIYAQEEKGIPDSIPDEMKPFVEAMKDYVSAWRQDYEEMSKYRKPFYTYEQSILQGVAFISDKDDYGNFSLIFYIKNNTKNAINLEKVFYRVVKNDGSIYRFVLFQTLSSKKLKLFV